MQDLPLAQVQGQFRLQLNFKFTGGILHALLLSHVVYGCLWNLPGYSQTNKQGWGVWGVEGLSRGGTFFLLTFKAHGRNSLLIEVRGERMESRGHSRGFRRAAVLAEP